jgi:2-hydroxychromene-2-carboxylate isomerase
MNVLRDRAIDQAWKQGRLAEMANLAEFIFDVGSPTAYITWTQLPGMIQKTGADIKYTPVLLGGLFKASGNASPVGSPAKSAYIAKDC